MNKMRKMTCTALALMMIGSGVAGAVSATAEEGATVTPKPVYETEFTVGGWIQFYDVNKTSYLDQVKELARCGMNLIDAPTAVSKGSGSGATSSLAGGKQFYQELDAVAQQVGMYYMLTDGDIFNFDYVYDMASDLENCIAYHLKDEPSSAQMDALAETVRAYKEGDPDRIPFVNLFPSYAGATNLGGTYRDYVSKWVNVVGADNMDWLYFDHYPFTQTESVRSTYFSDLEVIRDVAYKNGKIKTGGFTQMGSWNGMTRPTEDMARWSINSLLTYGLKSISHFCWVAPAYVSPENGGEGMRDFVTDSDGNPTDLYDPVSIMNWQTRQIGSVLMNVDVKHAYHTGKAPTGAEALPSSFILQPGNASDSFVYSIAYSKDTNEPYLLVFNKALDGAAKEYSFNVDLNTGVQSLTYYKPTDYTVETMPDPYNLEETLLPPEEVSIDVTSGSFTDTFKPGEMKVYKIEGENVEIFEDLSVPESTHSSGVYTGPQTINLLTGDAGAKIYYTMDGSFPTPGKDGTYLYDEPIRIGAYGESKTYTIRAISIRGTDVSEVLDLDMMIMDASYNPAGGQIGKFISLDGAREIGFSGFNGSSTNIKHLTDGSFDPNSSVLCTDEVGWAVVDFGEEKTIDRVSFSFWHDWYFGDVKIQIATKEDFSDAKTVFESASMQNVAGSGSSVSFEPTTARYIRATNNCKGEGKTSIFTELQAHTYYNSGTDLIADTANWSNLALGEFTNDGKTIKNAAAYQTNNWDKAYSYNAKQFKNFMIDAKMSIDVSDPGAWGYVGVQIFRENTDVVQSSTGKGLVVGIEPKGRALLWNGSKEVGALDANIVGWSVGSTFDFKLIAYNGTISLAINGRPILNQYLSEYAGKSGYVSIHAGLLPMTVDSFSVTELDESFTFAEKGYALRESENVKIAVEKYVAESEVLKRLGNTVQVTDTAGNAHTVGVSWIADGYDRTKTGNFDFIGTLNADDLERLNLSNAYGVKAVATVFVKSEIDSSVINNLIDVANGLNENEYTAASWEYLQLKVKAAESILADPFLVQSDVNVGMFQLYDAIYKYLVYTGDLTDFETAIAAAKAYQADAYTEYSYADLATAIEQAEAYYAQTFKTFAGVKEHTEALSAAQKALIEKAEEKPVLDITAPTPSVTETPTESSCASAIGSVSAAVVTLGATALVVGKKSKKDE